MKIALVILALFALPTVMRSDDSGKRTVAQEALALIKQAHPYAPAAPRREEEKKGADDQVVTMEQVVVAESLQLRDLREKIAAQNEKLKAERFSPVKGGAVLKKDIGRTRIEVGAWGAGSGLNILRISW